jgi:hypothetical protein
MPLGLDDKPFIEVADGKHATPESEGWQTELTFRGVFGKETFYFPVKGRPTQLKRIESYVYREFRVKVPPCKFCRDAIELGKIEESCCYVKKASIKTGLYHRCFIGALHGKTGRSQDYTEQYMDWRNERVFKLVKEEAISIKEVEQKFLAGELDYVADYGLIMEFEAKTGNTF